jgi:hypothetical protein
MKGRPTMKQGDLDVDAILNAAMKAVGMSEAAIAQALEEVREGSEQRKLARQVIDEGYTRLVARLGPDTAAARRVQRVRDVLHRAVKTRFYG